MLSELHLEKQNDYKNCLRKRRLLPVAGWVHSFNIKKQILQEQPGWTIAKT